jgi:hypothetical protein
MASGLIVYLLLAAILLLMWRQVRGKSFADLLEQDLPLHHGYQRYGPPGPKTMAYGWDQFKTMSQGWTLKQNV